jgi:putative transposase
VYSLETLPDDVRAALLNRLAEERLPLLAAPEHEAAPAPAVVESNPPVLPVGDDSALSAWRVRPESCRQQAEKRLRLVNQARMIKTRTKMAKTAALKRLAEQNGVSLLTLYGYIKAADQALETTRRGEEDSVTAQILVLTPEYGKNAGRIRAWSPEALEYAKTLYLSPRFLNVSDVFEHTAHEGRVQGWKVGSYDSLRRLLDREVDDGLQTLARRGSHRYQAGCELKILRDYREIWPNAMWVGDHHIFDCFVRAPGGKVLRPWLTAWMDMASRSFMGWCISFQPNSETIGLALAHAISRKDDAAFPQHGLPQSVYVDNGKDYRSQHHGGEEVRIGTIDYPEIIERFAGLGIDPYYIDFEYGDKEQAWIKKRGERNIEIQGVRVGGVFARLGIRQRFATAYHPWGKPIERAFRNVAQRFSREQPGWCGSGVEQRPEKLTFELRRGLLLDFEEFCQRWYAWVVHGYNKTAHSGHGMEGRSPDEVFTAYGAPQAVDAELLTFALLRRERVKIHNWGFKLGGLEFELAVSPDLAGAALLNQLINRYVTVLYDMDLKIVRVYQDGRFMCAGRRLRRASFIREDDPVMVEKLRLQAYQGRLNETRLKEIRENAPPQLASKEEAVLALTAGREEPAERPPRLGYSEDHAPKTEKPGPIFLTEEERYRAILRNLAEGRELSEADKKWRTQYEAGREYQERQRLYEAEFKFMRHHAERRAV